jgi:hypothetical protein
MKRYLMLGVAMAFALVAPMSTDAFAKSSRCAVKNMDGKKITWSCKAGRKCCFDWLANKGACVAASDICL